MGGQMKNIFMVAMLVIVGILSELDVVYGAGECWKSSRESVLYKLAPCAAAAQDKNAKVSRQCCNEVKNVDKRCLCAITLSTEAKSLGIKPEAAMTIPKRCKFSQRPVGYKCGGFTVP